MGKGVLPLSSLQFRHFRGPNHQPDLPHHGFRHPGPNGPQTLHRHDRHQQYFKGGEAPEKTAMGILGAVEHLLVRFPDTHVLLLGIFPRGTGPQDKLRQHNDRINAILAQCKLPRTTYANINRRFLDSSGKLLPGISRDNLHFTEKGYAIWADAVLPYIKKYCK